MAAEQDCREKDLNDGMTKALLQEILLPIRNVDPSAMRAGLKFLRHHGRIDFSDISPESAAELDKYVPALK